MNRTIRHPATSHQGTTDLRTTAYHPSANGMVERLNRQLKAAIMCHQNNRWTEALFTVMLGIRATWKEDIQGSSAELAYGQPLLLPGAFLGIPHNENGADNSTASFVKELHQHQPLQQPYDGPSRVIRRSAKTFVVNIKSRDVTVSIDRLKLVYILNHDTPTSWFGRDTVRTMPTTDEPTPFADQSRDHDDEVPASITARKTDALP
ncbi:uncharacterized protein LOC135135571 [Zophobas morio]|uniref:uncharacterized protein LOC135135571 n=1 Tax=Zophobas morio TaxID=2755281 RepID=UPI003082DC86